jgi:hypothetical protein
MKLRRAPRKFIQGFRVPTLMYVNPINHVSPIRLRLRDLDGAVCHAKNGLYYVSKAYTARNSSALTWRR